MKQFNRFFFNFGTKLRKLVVEIKQSLFANAGYLLGVDVINSLSGFLFWGLATRFYYPEDIGLALAVNSSVALVSLISGFGTGNGLIRFLPESDQPNRLINSLFIFNIATAFAVGSIILLILPRWSTFLTFLNDNLIFALAGLAYGIAMTFTASLRMTFLALRRAKFAFWQATSINSARLMLLVLFVGFGAWGLVGSVSIAVFVSILFSFFVFLPRAMPAYRLRFTVSKPDLSTILPFSFGIYVANLFFQAPNRLLSILILGLVDPASAAYAQIAWLVGGILIAPGLALATSAFVESSNLPNYSAIIFSKSVLIGMIFTFLASSIMIVIAPWFLLLFGKSYSFQGTTLLRLLSAAAPFAVQVGFYFSYLRFQKRILRLIGLSAVVAVTTICLGTVLISSLGIAAFGIGWFVGFLIVATVALNELIADKKSLTIFKHQSRLLFSTLFR